MRSYRDTVKYYEFRQLKRRVTRYALIFLSLFLAFLATFFQTTWMGRQLELFALRSHFQVRGSIPQPEEIVIVAVDKELFEAFGTPLPRSVYATLFEKISKRSPKAFIADYAFPPDKKDPAANERMGLALSRMPSVLGTGDLVSTNDDRKLVHVGNEAIIKAGVRFEIPMQFRQTDGVVRAILNKSSIPDETIPFTKVMRTLLGVTPVLPDQLSLINYYGPPGILKRISGKKILEGAEEDLKALDGKIVFFGVQNILTESSAWRDEEQFRVAYSKSPMYGVEVHATIAANLLQRNWLRMPGYYTQAMLLFLLVFASSLLLLFASPKTAYGSLLSGLVCLETLTYFLFAKHHMWLPVVPFGLLFAILSVMGIALFRTHLSERLERLINGRMKLADANW